MVRKISMKRKHKNRRTKSKLAFRKTKKLVRKNQTRRRRRQVGGGGCAASKMLPDRPSPYRKLSCDVSQTLTSEYIESLLVNPEEEAIRRFEKLFEETQINENSTFDMNGDTKSILFYLVNSARSKPIPNIYQKLFRWLIEKGAEVNYVLIPPESITYITPYVSLMYTIVGNVMDLMFNVTDSICDKPAGGCDIYDVNKLYDLYNCIYTLVLLLSKDANVLVKIRDYAPLDALNSVVIARIQSIICEGRNLELWVPPPPPPPDITRTKEYVVPRLLLLFEPINSLLALAHYNNEHPVKDEVSLNIKFEEVKRVAVSAVTAINGLNCASLELTREPPPVDAGDIEADFDFDEAEP
jgi:hypothetical protein